MSGAVVQADDPHRGSGASRRWWWPAALAFRAVDRSDCDLRPRRRRRTRSRDIRRQRDLRRLPPRRSGAVALLAAQARHGPRDRQIRARRFQRCELRLLRRALALLPQGREVSGRDRRARRQARHLRGQVHLRRRSAAAIPRRVSRRPTAGAVDRLGQPAEGQGRPALVPSLSERGDQARRRPALDQAEPELELHVRRVPFDRRAQELRRGQRSLRHDFAEISVGCEACHGQGSRHVGWARDAAELVAVRQERRPGARGCSFASTSGATSSGRSIRSTGNAARNFTPALRAQGGRDLRPVPRAPRPVLRGLGSRPVAVRHACGLAARARALSCRRADARRGLQLRLVQAEQDVRGRRHLQRLPRAARRQAARCPAMASACNATPSDKYAAVAPPPSRGGEPAARLRVVPHAGTHLHGGRSPARSQLPRPAPRSVGRSSARRTPATIATATSPPNGRRRRSNAGMGRAARASRPTPRRSMRHGRAARMRRRCLPAVARIARRRYRARERADRAWFARLAVEYQSGAGGAVGSRSDGADRRARHARGRAGRAALAARLAAALRFQSRRAHQGRRRCLPAVPTASQPPADRERFERAAAEFIAAQRLNADRPEARSMLGNLLRPARAASPMRRPSTRPRCGSVHNMRPRQSISPISTASSGATAKARACCARRSMRHRATQGCITRSGSRSSGSSDPTRRSPNCAAPPSSSRIAHATSTSTRSRSFRRPRRGGHDGAEGGPGKASGGPRHPAGAHQLQPRRRRPRDGARIRRTARQDRAERSGGR